MKKSKYFLSADIGSEYIKLIIFESDLINNELKPIKHIIRKVEESDLNNRHPERCIKETFKKAIEELNITNIDKSFVAINNENLISETVKTSLTFDNPHIINENIVDNLYNQISEKISKREEILYIKLHKFIIDNKLEVSNPLIMEAKSIDRIDFVAKIEKKHLDFIDELMESVELEANAIIPGSICEGEILVSSQEKNLGSALINIGYSTTNVTCYEGGNIKLSFTLNLGIGDFIETLSKYYNIKYKDTYYIYKEYANLLQKESDSPKSFIDLDGEKQVITVGVLNKIIEDFIKQYLETIKQIFINKKLNIHSITLSGGISNLQGIKNITKQVFNIHRVKVGKLNDLKYPEYTNNKWATCFGLIKIAVNVPEQKVNNIYNILYKIKVFIEKLLK